MAAEQIYLHSNLVSVSYCVTLGKLLNFPMPQFPHFRDRYNDTAYAHKAFVRNFEEWGLGTLGRHPHSSNLPQVWVRKFTVSPNPSSDFSNSSFLANKREPDHSGLEPGQTLTAALGGFAQVYSVILLPQDTPPPQSPTLL